ncbi:DUF2750 domain-containing protein [Vibrio rarus]|uniref:DUF2750 domain-containing protein n=1 Tax=Vibrio rarus TaxID=413403 RepID=UPI0021C4123C|nr:DUF2750 domain-containing protein [Vibrio rarus]
MSQLSNDIQQNLDLFIEQSKKDNRVWGLKNEDGWLACDSSEFEECEVMPFWSDEADAKFHNVEEWSDFEVTEIPLDIFVEDWLITLSEDGVLIGTNWNAQLEGQELEPEALAKLYI